MQRSTSEVIVHCSSNSKNQVNFIGRADPQKPVKGADEGVHVCFVEDRCNTWGPEPRACSDRDSFLHGAALETLNPKR